MENSNGFLKYIMAGVFLFVLVGFGYASFAGKKQDQEYSEQVAKFQQAAQLMGEQQFEGALPLLQELEKEQPGSTMVHQNLGLVYANTGKMDLAAKHYQRVIDLNPYKTEESLFMLQYAQILSFTDKKEEALLVLERCATLPTPPEFPEYEAQVAQLTEQLSAES